MDAGTTVGMVLLCTASHLASPLRTAGLVGAALTIPHAFGFLSAPLLDRVGDPRRVVAAAAGLFAGLLMLTTAWLGKSPLPVVLVLALGAGAVGPMLTGGLSSLQEGRSADDRTRRLRAVDALTYGLAGAGAPVVVSALATAISPRGGLLALSCLGLVGGLLVLRLPVGRPPAPDASVTRLPPTEPAHPSADAARSGLFTVLRHAPLRRVALLTWVGALLVSAALLTGMRLGEDHASGYGGWVAVAFGLGGLAGGLALTIRPLRMQSDRGMVLFVAALAPPLVAVVLVERWFPAVLATYALLGLVVAPQTVLSLAARGEHAPDRARRSVFVTIAGTKVAFASAGTALAGLAEGWNAQATLTVLAAVALASSIPAGAAIRGSRRYFHRVMKNTLSDVMRTTFPGD
ncbi:MFS family permease [Phycicoccus badiiscoriae]|uniref:MFS family permease n=2 Tax=Pedococcus badiiscoriae TaxID=642776 RepID=A0A852WCV3_9MICO|nr:MFS transporter [Pedococcus badiiscoriae]NYG07107.1 MFS family permease [Pedococcus badiiscoriae]